MNASLAAKHGFTQPLQVARTSGEVGGGAAGVGQLLSRAGLGRPAAR